MPWKDKKNIRIVSCYIITQDCIYTSKYTRAYVCEVSFFLSARRFGDAQSDWSLWCCSALSTCWLVWVKSGSCAGVLYFGCGRSNADWLSCIHSCSRRCICLWRCFSYCRRWVVRKDGPAWQIIPTFTTDQLLYLYSYVDARQLDAADIIDVLIALST